MPPRNIDREFELYDKARAHKKKPSSKQTLKISCPVHRIVETEDGPKCSSVKRVSKVNAGPLKGTLSNGKVRSGPLGGLSVKGLQKVGRKLEVRKEASERCRGWDEMPYQRFSSAWTAMGAFFGDNPRLAEAVGTIWWSPMNSAYSDWMANGRRGPRPTPRSVMGAEQNKRPPELDFLTGYAGEGDYYSITEGLHRVFQKAGRWDVLLPFFVELLEEVNRHAEYDLHVGDKVLEINIPGKAGKVLERYELMKAECMGGDFSPSEIIAEIRREEGLRPGEDEVPF